jgi:hypothetical protein
MTPEEIKAKGEAIAAKLLASFEVTTNKAADLVAKGWRATYTELFGQKFVDVLAPHHIEAVEWHWDSRVSFLKNENPEYKAYFPIWPRGHMKSTLAERMVVVDAVLSVAYDQPGFALYIGREKDKVKEHVSNIEALMTSETVRKYAPRLSEVARNEETNQKRQWTATFLHTKADYVVKGGSIESSQAGARVGETRPTFIVPDDIDGREDSAVISEMRFKRLTGEILPMRQQNTLVYFAQNLISRYSVMYRIQSGQAKVLTNRKPTIPIPAVIDLVTEQREVDGMLKDVYVSGQSTWQFWDEQRIKDEIETEGLTAFLVECQHEIEFGSAGRVISNHSEKRQIITWSQFESVYGTRRIPAEWKCEAGLDVGYSEGTYPHYSAWVFLATASFSTKLPRKKFVYRSRFFKGTSIDDQADAIKADMYPGETVQAWRMSHERTGEMLTLNQKHDLPFSKFTHFKPEDGVAQWKHLNRANHAKPNPFKPDELKEDGTWEIGDCELFYIVDDLQEVEPKDDKGQSNLRRQIPNWEYVPVKLTESGQTVQKPSKTDEDGCDALKGTLVFHGPEATEKTVQEIAQEKYQAATIYARPEYQHDISESAQMSRAYAHGKVMKELKDEGLDFDDDDVGYSGIDITEGY